MKSLIPSYAGENSVSGNGENFKFNGIFKRKGLFNDL